MKKLSFQKKLNLDLQSGQDTKIFDDIATANRWAKGIKAAALNRGSRSFQFQHFRQFYPIRTPADLWLKSSPGCRICAFPTQGKGTCTRNTATTLTLANNRQPFSCGFGLALAFCK